MTWCVFPSANAANADTAVTLWRARGYAIAVLLNGAAAKADIVADIVIREAEYRGWGASINHLAGIVPGEWVVGIGDDMDPDPTRTADDIAWECVEHFGTTLGVMQPTGDPSGEDGAGARAAERICGSPWLGRAFIERMGGKPFREEFHHFYGDEFLKLQAESLRVLWQRRDLCQLHHHWSFEGRPRPDYMEAPSARWDADKATFERLTALGEHLKWPD